MKQALAVAAVVGAVSFGGLQGCANLLGGVTADNADHKVVIQVSEGDPKTWNLALNNAKNVLADVGKDKAQIEIVAYGPGLGMLKSDSKVAPRLADALDNNIGLVACENTMRNTKTSKEDMYGGIGYVAAGVVHIMKRQSEGWAYVRP
jgi:intracellular sulfur oxidation DsrE/DsrF family protein